MNTYTVIYTEDPDILWQFFRCQAENGDHAEEQCRNAYPGCDVVWVNEGDSVEMK